MFCRLGWSSATRDGYRLNVSNGNAAAALMVTVAMLTGMSHLHGTPARRHSAARLWSSPERAELGDSTIPVRTVRHSYAVRARPGGFFRARAGARGPGRERTEATEAAAATDAPPEVIVGYVDPARNSTTFHRLTHVTAGDRVKVIRQDHSVDWYTVDSIHRAIRRNIDRERSSTGRPELRLISWRGRRSPRNVVVSAHLDRPAAGTSDSPERAHVTPE